MDTKAFKLEIIHAGEKAVKELIDVAKEAGATCIGINLEPPMNIAQHDEFHQGKAGELLPRMIEKIVK